MIKEFKQIYKKEIKPRLEKKKKLDSEIDKLYSEIFNIFSCFDKRNNCQILWKDCNFDLKDITIKQYNKDKTGFIITDMDGSSKEVLLKKKVCDKCGQEIKNV